MEGLGSLVMNAAERYSRQTMLSEIGAAGQKILKESAVMVVGAGGLGSPILLYLAAAGLGRIGIIDDDRVNVSNLQRQILYKTNDIGEQKASLASRQLRALNPEIKIVEHRDRLTATNAEKILSTYDVIVDATDNFSTRLIIDNFTYQHQVPFVYGSVAGFTGQVSIFNTNGAGRYIDLFPEPDLSKDTTPIGVLGAVAGCIGAIQATETVKLLLKKGSPLTSKLLVFDFLKNAYDIFEL